MGRFNEVNPRNRIPADLKWSFDSSSPARSSYRPNTSASTSTSDSSYKSQPSTRNAIFDNSTNSLNISSQSENGLSIQLTYEPLLLQKMAVNINDIFYGPEIDTAFKDFTDSGHCAQFTVAVVVDTLDTKLRYILIPLRNGVTIRVSVERILNLRRFRKDEIKRRKKEIDNNNIDLRRAEARKEMQEIRVKYRESGQDAESSKEMDDSKIRFLMDINDVKIEDEDIVDLVDEDLDIEDGPSFEYDPDFFLPSPNSSDGSDLYIE